MYDLALWIKIPKSLGTSSVKQVKIYKKSLFILDDVQTKIDKARQTFSETSNISDFEIEVYSRYLSSLTCLLLRNYEDIVNSSLEIIIFALEKTLSQEEKNLKKIRKSLSFCQLVKEECKTGSESKGKYKGLRIEAALEKIDSLQECVLKKYFNNNL
ncbi:hypothetical protein SteCoe_34162 [Stentor coeruleus]|uniref:Uncharacterized protein n=1 Tax=Stentor coeruleus TaxID=5963 RepID=A0A1R2AV47_9CILI|nr:hypothetical protein SteCoe_34162 [Stentor coeruleus]